MTTDRSSHRTPGLFTLAWPADLRRYGRGQDPPRLLVFLTSSIVLPSGRILVSPLYVKTTFVPSDFVTVIVLLPVSTAAVPTACTERFPGIRCNRLAVKALAAV